MKRNFGKTLSTILFLISNNVFAAAYTLPDTNRSLIGGVQYSAANNGDTVVTVAKRYDIGFNAIQNANPNLDMHRGFQPGTQIAIPTQHLLPNQPRQGIVINLPEMRMYYYPAGTNKVLTYPIGIGKIGKTIPIKKTVVTRKTKNPVWIPPDDIRQFNLEQGIVLPRVMRAGPDNPLGPYAIYTGLPTYLIHSTIFPESVGTRASFGCIRMYESDIESFFPSVKSGIPISIINSPVKIGWQNERLYMETHEPLKEHVNASDTTLPGMVSEISNASKDTPALIDWQAVAYAEDERDGLPHEIGFRLPSN